MLRHGVCPADPQATGPDFEESRFVPYLGSVEAYPPRVGERSESTLPDDIDGVVVFGDVTERPTERRRGQPSAGLRYDATK